MCNRSEQTHHQRRYKDGNKHMRIFSTLFVLRKMACKTMRYHCTPIRIAKINFKKTSITSDVDTGQQQLLFIACENAKGYSHFGKNFGNYLQS